VHGSLHETPYVGLEDDRDDLSAGRVRAGRKERCVGYWQSASLHAGVLRVLDGAVVREKDQVVGGD